MTRFSLLFSLGLTLAATASASSLCVNNDTYANYISLGAGGCDVGNLHFSNFTASLGTVSSSAVNVGVVSTPGNEGLQFVASSFFDVFTTINYQLDTIYGSTTSATLAGIASAPTWNVNELLLTPVTFLNVNDTSAPGAPFLGVSTTPFVTNSTNVQNLMTSSGGNLIQVTNTFGNATPEPVSYVLFGSGLVAISLLRKKLKA